MNAKPRYGIAVVALWVVLLAGRAGALEVTVDAFTEATNTAIIPGTQILANMQGQSTTAMDGSVAVPLTTVVGGVRKMTVTATFIGAVGEKVVSGIDTGAPDLCYNSSNDADGQVELVYDRDGLGLKNLNLSHGQGIEIALIGSDSSSTPYLVKVTLEDSSGNSASSQQTSSDVCPPTCPTMQFPFTDFSTVNLRRIVRITVLIDPNKAADIAFGQIITFGTPNVETICDDGEDNDNNGLTDCADPACAHALNCIETAPLLSSGMVGVMIALLSGVGLTGMARARRRQ